MKVRLIAGNRPPLSIGPLPILYRRQEKAQLNLHLDPLLSLFKDTGQKVLFGSVCRSVLREQHLWVVPPLWGAV